MELKDIQNLIKFVAKSGASEVKLEMEDIKITVKTGSGKTETTILQSAMSPAQMPVVSQVVPQAEPVAAAPAAPAAPATAAEEDSNLVTITSPIIGTFYRKPSPDKANFIEIGGFSIS